MSVKLAAIQFEPTMFEKERNIEKLYHLIEEAAENGAKLITTPEMATTGYCWYDREEVEPFVEPIPGPTTESFYELAKRYDCYMVIGMPEVDVTTNLYYNSAVLIGPQGIVGVHRKTHLYISEPKWAASGDLGHQVFDTPIGRIALLICMDLHFIETARLVALKGADVICHISNWLAERTPAPYWINRAYENHCYLIESNRWGYERTVQFSGGSCIINPDGSIQSVVDLGDGIAYGTMEVEDARSKTIGEDTIFEDRKPHLYSALLTDPYLWNPLDFFGLYGQKPLPPGKKSKIAVAQIQVTEDKERNLSKIADEVKIASQEGAELIVFPECSLSGYVNQENAETIPGESTNQLVTLSKKYHIYIVSGLVEKEGNLLYNTAILTGPEGFIGKYRKIHLNHHDKMWATSGEQWITFDLPIGRVGLLMGYDAFLPESVRILTLLGCDLIACPSAIKVPITLAHSGTHVKQNYPIPTSADPYHWHLYRVRAGENNVYLAFSNSYDMEAGFVGKSGIFGPDTFHFPRDESMIMDEEGITYLQIDTTNEVSGYPTNVVRRKDLVMMRQPHDYKDLIQVSEVKSIIK
ncbi:amidohydrolase [Terrilactibacillus sp. BCM23-1]|uniref:Amidohydrolase n=1 Tax=Terrilactibacillus tamarindi TaxID=2599694 RepID=A0A6N8CPT1_9BACI|nr:nitrilase-related carbon-nitrogen hydrolase [Terrilactibacillus tamarindi]MTT32189.1 amidohydrolase [Terrilactibacillus tamarindi]